MGNFYSFTLDNVVSTSTLYDDNIEDFIKTYNPADIQIQEMDTTQTAEAYPKQNPDNIETTPETQCFNQDKNNTTQPNPQQL